MKNFIGAILSAALAAALCEAGEEPAKKQFTLHPIGTVENKEGKSALVIDPQFTAALLELDRYSHVWVIWWLDRNDTPEKRAVLRVYPRGNRANGLAGVFACRSPFRPNLTAMSLCKILAVKDRRIEIEKIDAFDGSPVLDLKPYVPELDSAKDVKIADWRAKPEQ